jgi:hypothetical protein
VVNPRDVHVAFIFGAVLQSVCHCASQGSFFWLQNKEGEPVVGGWL